MDTYEPTPFSTESPSRLTLEAIRPFATISVEDYARLWGVGRGGAYSAVKRGEVPGVIRIGRRIRISVPALLKSLCADDLEPVRLDVQRTHSGPLAGRA